MDQHASPTILSFHVASLLIERLNYFDYIALHNGVASFIKLIERLIQEDTSATYRIDSLKATVWLQVQLFYRICTS